MAETVRGLNIKLTLDAKDLQNELTNIKANLKEQQKDLKAINTSLRYDSTNLDLWKKKQETLNSILEETKKKLQNQNEQLEKAKKALEIGDISVKELNQLRRNVEYTEADISKLNNQLEDTTKKINELGNANLNKLSKVGSNLSKYVTAPILGAVTALTTLSIKSAETADELGDQASKLGMSVEALQEWNYVAKLLAVDNEQLQKAFTKTNSLLGDLASGNTSSATTALEKLGITYDDLKGKNVDEAFEIIRNALANLEDETLRVGIANDIFGEKIGTDLQQLLSASSTEIDNFRNECQELGVITEEEVEASAKFNDELDKVKQELQTLGVELAQILLPIMTEFLTYLKDSIIPKISEWANKLASMNDTTKKTILVVIGLVAAIGPAIKIITTIIPIVKGLSTALTATGTSGFFAGAGISAATLGIGALIAILIMALTQTETFKDILMELGSILMQILEPVFMIVEAVGEVLMPIIELVMEVIGNLINLLVPLLNVLLLPIKAVLDAVGKILEAFMPLFTMLAEIIQRVIAPVLEVLYAVLKPILDILNAIIECIQWILDHTVGWLMDIVDTVVGWFTPSSSNETNTSNSTVNNQTTNNVTINTSSSTFDVDTINEALGGSYL
jgi:predicted  nucleic acid-binding Zn-ribbon protein